MNKNKLEAKIIYNNDNNKILAKYLDISYQTLYNKLNNSHSSDFTRKEIKKIKEKYNLTSDEIDDIFFKD